MADFGLTETGLKIKRLEDIMLDLHNEYRNVAGNDVNLDPQSTQGQEIAIWSADLATAWEQLENCYNSFDPSASTGTSQSRLVLLNGLKRKPAIKSTAIITILGIPGSLIPAGSSVSTSDGKIFSSKAAFTIPLLGGGEQLFESAEPGAVTALAGQLNIIETPEDGWVSANNAQDAFVGNSQELDSELRKRQAYSAALPASNIIDSLYAAILNVENVVDVVIYNNNTNVVSPEGVPAHRFMPVVFKGSDEDISKAIYVNHTSGDKSYGSTTTSIQNVRDQQVLVQFEKAVPVDIHIKLTIKINSAFPTDGVQQIKDSIVAYASGNSVTANCDNGFLISEDVIYSRLFTPINDICGHDVQELLIGIIPIPSTIGNIPIGFNQISNFTDANIEIIET